MEQFSCGTRIVSGAGAIEALAEFGAKRLFLVTEPSFRKNGAAKRVADAAKAEQVQIFDRVTPEITGALAAEGTAELAAFGPDLAAALGGENVLECAKIMVLFSKRGTPLAAIPTTSGSGTEVTDFAVLTHNGVRHPLTDRRLRPALAILDSELLGQLTREAIAEGGFEILAHAAEAYVGKNSGAISDVLAREAFGAAYANLPASFAGRQEVRLKIHMAAAMAGMSCSQAGLGLCHAMSHALGGMFRVPQGRLNAVLLPSVIASNAHVSGRRYAQLARAAGMGGSTDAMAVRNLENGLIRLRRELELPETLAQAGIPPRAVWNGMKAIVTAALADPCCKTNPMTAEDFQIRRILEEVTGRI